MFSLCSQGALFVWSFERWAGRFGIGLQDRALRFVGGLVVFLAIAAWPIYWLYANCEESIANREPLPLWFWIVPVLYIGAPLVAGSVLGSMEGELAVVPADNRKRQNTLRLGSSFSGSSCWRGSVQAKVRRLDRRRFWGSQRAPTLRFGVS